MKTSLALFCALGLLSFGACGAPSQPASDQASAQADADRHRAQLASSLDTMLKAETPAAREHEAGRFAQAMTDQDLADLGTRYLTDLTDPVGSADTLRVKVGILSDVAGLAPQETINLLIQNQIIGRGSEKKAALSLLMLRIMYLRDTRLGGDLLNRKLSAVSDFTGPDGAVTCLNQIEYLAAFRFADHIAFKALDYDEKIRPTDMLALWKKIGDAIPRDDEQSFIDVKNLSAARIAYWTAKNAPTAPPTSP